MSDEPPDTTQSRRNGRSAVARMVDAVESVKPQSVDLGFALALLAFVGTLTYLSFGYRFESRIVPLVIGIPTLVLLLILVGTQVSERFGWLDAGDALSGSALPLGNFTGSTDELEPDDRRTTGEGRPISSAFGWLALLLAVPYLVGIRYGILLFLVAAYRFYGRESWFRTGIWALVIWGFIIVIFEVILNIRL